RSRFVRVDEPTAPQQSPPFDVRTLDCRGVFEKEGPLYPRRWVYRNHPDHLVEVREPQGVSWTKHGDREWKQDGYEESKFLKYCDGLVIETFDHHAPAPQTDIPLPELDYDPVDGVYATDTT